MNAYSLILSTFSQKEEAQKLLRLLLEQKKVACGNILSGMESHYWWESKIESAQEVLLLLKTESSSVPEVQDLILKHHPYDLPEIIVIAISQGNPHYLQWISDSLK